MRLISWTLQSGSEQLILADECGIKKTWNFMLIQNSREKVAKRFTIRNRPNFKENPKILSFFCVNTFYK
jgi:hypothetical protein